MSSSFYSNTEKLSKDLENLFNLQNQFNDFDIICKINENQQTVFKCHKSILSSRSQYFNSLFRSKMKEFHEGKIILQDVSKNTLSSILQYFYSGKLELTINNAINILIFSVKYLIEELIQSTSNFIIQNCGIETVVDILKISESLDLNDLSISCYNFINSHFIEFSKSSYFYQLEENQILKIISSNDIAAEELDIFQFLIDWAKNQENIPKKIDEMDNQEKSKIKLKLSNLFNKIRFIDFRNEDFSKFSNLELIPNQISNKIFEYYSVAPFDNSNYEDSFKKIYREEEEKKNSLIFTPRIDFQSGIFKNIGYYKILKEWIDDPIFFQSIKLGFSAKRNGFSCVKFHEICDGKGKTLVVIKSKDGFIFGGYTSVGWDKSKIKEHSIYLGDWIKDENAFLFSLKNPLNSKPFKLPIEPGQELCALRYEPKHGPYFGNSDLSIDGNLRSGSSDSLGFSYVIPSQFLESDFENRKIFSNSDRWEIEEIEIYFHN
ncbi:pep-cterm sorting domain-containing protein [Anaeramoeba ignava]|uniref:Pep-cterm sorting domain-containing protein n=1 Tax=Anaeramoeba ignava TaxID=1746090 RepID=A0A9Q0LRJ7_ANAIG|nr:pep-cterm sorting domain-containing protein [Anaeramoeba ignava]